jgi:ABC-type glutathione transport system ATPase component
MRVPACRHRGFSHGRRRKQRIQYMSEPVIRIEGVSRTYHVGDIDVCALRDVSLTVEHGEFIAIKGASDRANRR